MNKNLFKNSLSCLIFSLLMLLGASTYASGDHGPDHNDNDSHDEHAESAEPQKGPHKGRLLHDGDFTLELAIFERGVPPEYRAWARYKGKTLVPKDWQLAVELTRLGGRVDTFRFAAQEDFLRGQSEVEEPHSFDVTVTATYKTQQYHWTFPSYEGRVQLSAALAEQSGVTTAVAGAGTLQQTLHAYGQVLPDHDQVRQLSARFPGIIRSAKVHLGEKVSVGEVLATIEANESLRSYNITAPIAGVVIARHANEGEMTGDHPLFSIADYRQLSVRMPIFARDAARVSVGQGLRVKSGEHESQSVIATLTPAADNSPTLSARALLDNSKGFWMPGSWVDAQITTAEIPVALRVDNRALQGFRDWQVVFIQVGDTYEIRPLELGQTDGHFTEVLGGLNVGDRYVVENSYLLKADLEKSGASHDH